MTRDEKILDEYRHFSGDMCRAFWRFRDGRTPIAAYESEVNSIIDRHNINLRKACEFNG